jgi:hypothetical protein
MKRVASSSSASIENQATGRSHSNANSLTNVVLPKPAGELTRVNFRFNPSLKLGLKAWAQHPVLTNGRDLELGYH